MYNCRLDRCITAQTLEIKGIVAPVMDASKHVWQTGRDVINCIKDFQGLDTAEEKCVSIHTHHMNPPAHHTRPRKGYSANMPGHQKHQNRFRNALWSRSCESRNNVHIMARKYGSGWCWLVVGVGCGELEGVRSWGRAEGLVGCRPAGQCNMLQGQECHGRHT